MKCLACEWEYPEYSQTEEPDIVYGIYNVSEKILGDKVVLTIQPHEPPLTEEEKRDIEAQVWNHWLLEPFRQP